MSTSAYQIRARQIVTRLSQLDLDDPKQHAAACKRVERALLSAADSTHLSELLRDLDKHVEYEAKSEQECETVAGWANRLRAEITQYVYPSLEAWWDTTSYNDVIEAEDQLFRDKPINLKRIVLEAFNAARRSEVIDLDS